MTNENVNEVATIEEGSLEAVVRDEGDYVLVKDENGKFKRRAKYEDYSSMDITTEEDKLFLLGLIDNEEDGQGLKDHVGKEIVVENIMTRAYDKVNEDTGQLEYGVLTYLITPEREAYVTSSKNVYFSLQQITRLFGTPDSDTWANIKVKIGKKKSPNGHDIITIKMTGLAK